MTWRRTRTRTTSTRPTIGVWSRMWLSVAEDVQVRHPIRYRGGITSVGFSDTQSAVAEYRTTKGR